MTLPGNGTLKNEVLIQVATGMNLKDILLSERRQAQKVPCYVISFMKCPENSETDIRSAAAWEGVRVWTDCE